MRHLGPLEQDYYRWRNDPEMTNEQVLSWFTLLARYGLWRAYPMDVGVELRRLVIAGLVPYREEDELPPEAWIGG